MTVRSCAAEEGRLLRSPKTRIAGMQNRRRMNVASVSGTSMVGQECRMRGIRWQGPRASVAG